MKKIIILLTLPFVLLMADFTLIGAQLTPISEQASSENLNSTVAGSSKYLEKVDIPAYNKDDPTHVLITPDNGKWNESIVNNLNYKHFYITPGKYTSSVIWLKSSGTSNDDRRTLSLYNPSNPSDDTHPAALADNKQADIRFSFNGASYWTVDRLSTLDTYDNLHISVKLIGASSHNIINRFYDRNMHKGIYIDPFCDYNTIQNSYIDTATHAGRVADALGIGFMHNHTANAVTQGTKVINNDIRNLGDGIQLSRTSGAPETINYPDTIIDSNRIWIDGDIYTDGNWKSHGYDPNGEYAVAENAIDIKAGSSDSNRPVIVSNNIAWGYREIDQSTGQNSIAGKPFNISFAEVQNVIFDSNIIFDSQFAMQFMNLHGTVSRVTNNILYDIGNINPPIDGAANGRPVVALASSLDKSGWPSSHIPYNNNTIINVGTNDAGQGVTIQCGSGDVDMNNNVFINTQRMSGDIATQHRDNNQYYNHTGATLGGTNEHNQRSIDPQMGDYPFQYKRFTASPETKILHGVITTDNSPHYKKAGSSITSTSK